MYDSLAGKPTVVFFNLALSYIAHHPVHLTDNLNAVQEA